jgi:hypothetical protein
MQVTEGTMIRLALGVFGLTFLSFVLRGFGQFVVGVRTATTFAGPVAVLAGLLLMIVLSLSVCARLGFVSIVRDGQ